MYEPKLGLYAEKRRIFPPPDQTFDDGIVGMMDEISTEILFEAYSFGIFPWPHPELPLLWYSPDPRGILFFKDFHISKSLKKFMAKMPYTITFNKAFDQVLEECAEMQRPDQSGTWITSPMKNAYKQFHRDGYAHSVECWEGNELVGGLYGVLVSGSFSGESMFFKKNNASKVCLVKLVEKLQGLGLNWMDTQMVTHNLKDFGASYLPRDEFLLLLHEARKQAEPLKIE